MTKQLIEMQELPCGVFQFYDIGSITTSKNRHTLLAITTVTCYNEDLNSFPLSLLDLTTKNILLVRDGYYCNMESFGANDQHYLDIDNADLEEALGSKDYLVLFDPFTGERVPC